MSLDKSRLVRQWRAGSRTIVLERPIVMGILNVTPDSFSDGGNFVVHSSAIDHVATMIAQGADIIDVGGESTRPGAAPVSTEVEVERVVPLIAAVRNRWPEVVISVDTVKSSVACAALEAGADVINDVSAMRLDPAMPAIAARTGCGVVLMHSRGDVSDMASYRHAQYEDVTREVLAELASQLLLLEDAGVNRSQIVFDPGFGFAKEPGHSITLLNELEEFMAQDAGLLVGVSRKRFVSAAMTADGVGEGGDSNGEFTLEERDAATASLNVLALERGAMIFRVHNVAINRRALDAAWSVLNLQR